MQIRDKVLRRVLAEMRAETGGKWRPTDQHLRRDEQVYTWQRDDKRMRITVNAGKPGDRGAYFRITQKFHGEWATILSAEIGAWQTPLHFLAAYWLIEPVHTSTYLAGRRAAREECRRAHQR